MENVIYNDDVELIDENEEARKIIQNSEYCQNILDTFGFDFAECLEE